MYEPSFFFQPAKEWGLEMVDGRPKTPLLWTDGERGFVFFVPGEKPRWIMWDEGLGIVSTVDDYQ